MPVKNRKKMRWKQPCQVRQPCFESLETRQLLAGDLVAATVELVPDDLPQKPDAVEESAPDDVKAEVATDDTPVYRTLKVPVLDGTEDGKVPQDDESIDKSEVLVVRTLGGTDGGDEPVDGREEQLEPIRFSMMGATDSPESDETEAASTEVVLETLGGDAAECFDTEVQLAFAQVPWHNNLNPNDVNGDGYTSPLDALTMINWINDRGLGAPDNATIADESHPEAEAGNAYPDIDGDGLVAPMDVLLLINQLNSLEVAGEDPIATMAIANPGEQSDCSRPMTGTRIQMPQDGLDGDTIGNADDVTAGDTTGDQIFGIRVGEFTPLNPDANDKLDAVDSVFEEIARRSDPSSTDELSSTDAPIVEV